MNTGTLLVLGAGEDQSGVYLEARERGLRTVGVDIRRDAPSVRLADRFLPMTTRDADGIERSVRDENIVGVIAPASDAATPTARDLAMRLHLPVSTSAAAAACSVDKTAFRAVVEDLGLPAYRSVTSCDTDKLVAAAKSLGGRVVVKPTDSS
jgi:formate-dependent phosphoribosylglycinamide formyltransferase (GAR transformylase)